MKLLHYRHWVLYLAHMRKAIISTILLSMVLHCACRLGVIDHLYNNRKNIAFSIGVIKEMPIASCGSEYEHPLTIEVDDDASGDSVPATTFKAQQINLFLAPALPQVNCALPLLSVTHFVNLKELFDTCQLDPLFQPPRS
jgi:hypothetical protein